MTLEENLSLVTITREVIFAMRSSIGIYFLALTWNILIISAQFPQRLTIPGAVLHSQSKSGPFRQPQRGPGPPLPTENYPVPIPIRVRKPIPNALPAPVRPVIEEAEEQEPRSTPSFLDDEVERFGLSALQNAVRTSDEVETPRAVVFRPERPVPLLRENIRENPPPRPPPIRQPEPQQTIFREPPPRPQARQHVPPPQPIRQTVKVPIARQPPPQYLDDEEERRNRNRKPPVQILRKYRTDNEDGSITWGYENEDGSFKEETIGANCVITGKYGYVDPEGVRREYNYETGNKCDHREEEELPEGIEQQLAARPPPKKQYRVGQYPPQ